jgi:Holliday junction resolvase RusA-like endonuclease
VQRGRYTATYYAGRYKEFLQCAGPVALAQALEEAGSLDMTLPIEEEVQVSILFLVKKAKTSKLSTPKGDVDNYAKGALDLLQAGGVLKDDKYVTKLLVQKQFTKTQPCLQIEIERAPS